MWNEGKRRRRIHLFFSCIALLFFLLGFLVRENEFALKLAHIVSPCFATTEADGFREILLSSLSLCRIPLLFCVASAAAAPTYPSPLISACGAALLSLGAAAYLASEAEFTPVYISSVLLSIILIYSLCHVSACAAYLGITLLFRHPPNVRAFISMPELQMTVETVLTALLSIFFANLCRLLAVSIIK